MYKAIRQFFEERINVSLTQAQLDKIEKVFTPRRFLKGQVVLNEGDVCDLGYFVVKGCLRGYVTDESGNEYAVHFAPENWWMADLTSLVNKQPATFSIDVLEDTDVLAFEADYIERLLDIEPELAWEVMRLLFNSIRAIRVRLISHLKDSAEKRYEDFINTYPQLVLKIPQHMIASYIGVAPQSLSRIRARKRTPSS